MNYLVTSQRTDLTFPLVFLSESLFFKAFESFDVYLFCLPNLLDFLAYILYEYKMNKILCCCCLACVLLVNVLVPDVRSGRGGASVGWARLCSVCCEGGLEWVRSA